MNLRFTGDIPPLVVNVDREAGEITVTPLADTGKMHRHDPGGRQVPGRGGL